MRERGFRLRPTLVGGMLALILAVAGGVGGTAYVSSHRIVDLFWRELSHEIGQSAQQRALRYFEPAVPYVELTESLCESGHLDVDDQDTLLDHFLAAIAANEGFTWASFGSEDGRYVAAYRDVDGQLRATVREPAAEGSAETRWRILAPGPRGSWQTLRDDTTDHYDPRERSWYQQAMAGPAGGLWVEPFLFATHRQPGFMFVRRAECGAAQRGVWAVEYEMSYLSEFLSGIEVGEHGRAYVVSNSGLVVGHPKGEVTVERDGELQVAHAADHSDPMLAGAWSALGDRDVAEDASLEFGGYLAMVRPFPRESGLDWKVIVVAPVDDFFGPVRYQGLWALAVALAIAAIAMVLALLFANTISSALARIGAELDRVGHFDFDSKGLAGLTTPVREVNAMATVTNRMQRGLRSFARYVPRELVRDLLLSGREAVLGGKNEELTVLFSDIEGFTSVAEKLEPHELVDTLGDYLHCMSAEIAEQRGTVDKFIGDAIMAFWGAPRASEDHALRACNAALAMQSQLDSLQGSWRAQGRPPFHTRIGINTGEVLVGNIGAPERMNYTVMGDPVNLASRLEALNKTYGTSILVGERTAELVRDHFVLRPIDWVAVKGKESVVLVHELLVSVADLDPVTGEALALYARALELYRARSFHDAASLFEEADAKRSGGDPPSVAMAARCRRYSDAPPPLEWDGRHSKVGKD